MASIPVDDMVHHQTPLDLESKDMFDYSKRSQWLRAAVLGANDGLVSTASLMIGVAAVKKDMKAMILTGFAGLVAGACSMAIGEFVSVYSQLDIEVAHMKRDVNRRDINIVKADINNLPNPWQAAIASALAFALGAIVPLLAVSFVRPYRMRILVVVVVVTVMLAVFGWLGAVLGRAPTIKPTIRVVVGGWVAMGITYGLTMLIGTKGIN